jgi:hypothetical protein
LVKLGAQPRHFRLGGGNALVNLFGRHMDRQGRVPHRTAILGITKLRQENTE